MKKLFLVLLAVLSITICGTSKSSAQCALPDGSSAINLGLGLGHSDWGGNEIFMPSFNFAFDHSFLGNIINSNGAISGGGYFSIGHGSRKDNGVKTGNTQWRVGTRGALHYTWVRNLDTYAGLSIGARGEKVKVKDTDWSNSHSDFDMFPFAGVRYDLGGVALYSELATTCYSWFQIGVSFKF